MSDPDELFGNCAPPAGYASDPFPHLARLRERAPRHFVADRNAWLLSSHHDITTILRDPRAAITSGSSFADQTAHFRSIAVRRLRAWFGAARPALQHAVDTAANECFGSLSASRQVDLADAVARYLPSAVMAALMGIPSADVPALGKIGAAVLQSYDLPWKGCPGPEAAHEALPMYFQHHWRRAPDTPLMRMLRAMQADHSLQIPSMVDTCMKLFTAGTTTTSGCLANILARLVCASGETSAPGKCPSVDMLLRLDSPVLAIKRHVSETMQLGETTFASGQTLLLLIASANRTAAVPGQGQPQSLTFGLGPYHCLGAALAVLEVNALLKRLLPVIPKMRLVAPIVWRQAWLVHEARSILVTLDGKHAC